MAGYSSLQSRWIDVDGMRIHCRYRPGPGPAALLLPGGMLDSTALTWKHTLAALPKAFQAIAPDLPGYGRSAHPPVSYTTDFYIDFLEHLRRELALETFHLFGSSMSGAIALGYALRRPNRVRRLVLSGAYGVQPRVRFHPLVYAACRLPRAATISRSVLRMHPLVVRWALRIAIHNPRRITDELVHDTRAGLHAHRAALQPLDPFLRWMRHEIGPRRVRTNLTDRLPEIHRPVLLLHGRRDLMIPVRYVERAAHLLPEAELHVFGHCGHLVPRERPRAVNQLVRTFLSEDLPPRDAP